MLIISIKNIFGEIQHEIARGVEMLETLHHNNNNNLNNTFTAPFNIK